MLKQRVATAVALAGFFIFAVYLPSPWFAAIIGVVALVGAAEWARLSGITGRAQSMIWLVSLAVSGVALYLLQAGSVWIVALATAWWLAIALWLFTRTSLGRPGPVITRLAPGVLVLIPAWWALVLLHADEPHLVLWVALVVWIADSAAYFTGRRWGRSKLAPLISPGKTREGLYGALTAAAVFSALAGWLLWRPDPVVIAIWVGLSLSVALISVVGDLFESFMKRVAGVKDSGTTLPGHGGVLDRVDSISAAAPVFACGWFGVVKPLVPQALNVYAELVSLG